MLRLSFSLRKYDAAITRLIGEVKMGLDKTDPILGEIQTFSVAHGGTTRQVSEPEIVDTEMKSVSVEVMLELDWLRKTDVDQFVDFLWRFCDAFSSLAKKHLFETVSLTTEAVGNVFDAKGKNIWDAQIETLAGMEMRFDEDGNHNYKFYSLDPNIAIKMAANPPTPEQEKRWEETITAKREEYYAQKRTRRLS